MAKNVNRRRCWRTSRRHHVMWVSITCSLVFLGMTFVMFMNVTLVDEQEDPAHVYANNSDYKNEAASAVAWEGGIPLIKKAPYSRTTESIAIASKRTTTTIPVQNVKVVSDSPTHGNRTILIQPQYYGDATAGSIRGKLRRDWTHNPPLSKFARRILAAQSNCSLPTVTFHMDNLFGIGSHLVLWSQGICNGWEVPARLRTYNPEWLWLDQTLCDLEQAKQSPLLCYLPGSEMLCGEEELEPTMNVSDPRDKRNRCALVKQDEDVLKEFRSASTEFLFRKVSPLVIQEAQRQVGLLFGEIHKQQENDGVVVVPEDLITVHIRWGDKFFEMDLAAIEEYVCAVSDLLHQRKGHNTTAHIYLATEDPNAADAFAKAVPIGWKIYTDRTIDELNDFRPKRGNRASHTTRNTKGRAGLIAMGSLLVAMEAQDFVLTTGSNWSRIMNQLRTNIIDPRCGNCTRAIDLRPGMWR